MEASDLIRLSRVRSMTASGAARSVRLGADLSIREVAAAIGASPSTVWRWEHGERAPRGDVALRYLDLLEELMGRR